MENISESLKPIQCNWKKYANNDFIQLLSVSSLSLLLFNITNLYEWSSKYEKTRLTSLLWFLWRNIKVAVSDFIKKILRVL